MKCPKCSREVANDSIFCEYCGKLIFFKNRKIRKWIWGAIGVLIIIIVLVIVFATPPRGYVDMGLPSGTLWKNKNEKGLIAYDEAIKFGNKLPTQEQLDELLTYCKWTWKKDGLMLTSANGNSIFLPADGEGDSYLNEMDEQGEVGYYWLQKEKRKTKMAIFYLDDEEIEYEEEEEEDIEDLLISVHLVH